MGSSVVTLGKTLAMSGISALKGFGASLAAMARQAMAAAATALPGLISGVWAFTAALLANPITWVVIGIVALIATIILLWNKCEWFRNGVMAIFNGIKSGLSTVFNVAKSVFEGVKNAAGNALEAARSTVSEKLNNMKQAYHEHGGGIRGIAAAAVEGVKGYYTAGFTFIDNLTGGKLTVIKEKFTAGIQSIKDKITGAIGWFRSSGEKIMTTFTEGIKAAINKPVQAVKGALQKIRNMLPFSDAKEGPLSQLTLSGRKVMTTFSSGMQMEEDAPVQTVQKSFEKMDFKVATEKPEPKKKKDEPKPQDGTDGMPGGKKTIIQKLVLNVDLKKIKDLQKLLQLLEEIEDYTNGNGPDTEPEPQMV